MLVDLYRDFIFDELLGGQFLFEILRTSLSVKSAENLARSKCFKTFFDGERYFFRTEKWIQGLLCKNINISLTYYEISIYVKY